MDNEAPLIPDVGRSGKGPVLARGGYQMNHVMSCRVCERKKRVPYHAFGLRISDESYHVYSQKEKKNKLNRQKKKRVQNGVLNSQKLY